MRHRRYSRACRCLLGASGTTLLPPEPMQGVLFRIPESDREQLKSMSQSWFRFLAGRWALLFALAVLLPAVLASADEPKAKSSPAAIRQYRDAVTLQNQSAYDLAV